MGKSKTPRKPIAGKRTGKKRSDFHWTDPTGEIWDSRFEYIFYAAARAANIDLRRCTEDHTFSYLLPIRGGICAGCESTDVGQRRTYTPDFYYPAKDTGGQDCRAYIETKGYLRAKERALLRAYYNAHPDTILSVVLQRNYRVTKPNKSGDGSVVAWFNRFLPNVRVSIWSGSIESKLFTGTPNTSIGRSTVKRNSSKRSTKLNPE